MKILGISDTHEAAAALFKNGELIACCAEERFSRLKSDMGYPRQAVEYCLQYAGMQGPDLDAVLLATLDSPALHIRIKREATFSIHDWVDEQNLYWKKKFSGENVSYWDLFSNNPKYIKDEIYSYENILHAGRINQDAFRDERRRVTAEHLGVLQDKIFFVQHEQCHSYYGYFGSETREPALVFTCEGEGDYSNATVSIARDGVIQEVCHTRENHLAHFYRYITLILGMKPNQHEYKVMGLAPYASSYERDKVLPIFEGLLKVHDGNIVVDKKISDSYFYFIEKFQGYRFDGIAAALQFYVEEILKEWVDFHVKKTGISNVVFSGGVAQNIKAMKAIQDMDNVDHVYVNPISGDGSLSVGACYKYLSDNYSDKSRLRPLKNIYLGPDYSDQDVLNAIATRNIEEKYNVIQKPSPDFVARLLSEDKIIARSVGRAEFGQRALGNRSILANPMNPMNVKKINEKIKGRDFWMPFTPTILDYRAKDYLVEPIDCHFMTVAFDSTDLAQRDLIAAIHPADFTVRPQILKKEKNPEYYTLLQEFEKLTGVGALLNTSFNLHGEPIVNSPEDALHTFENSMLDGLLFDNFLVLRNDG